MSISHLKEICDMNNINQSKQANRTGTWIGDKGER